LSASGLASTTHVRARATRSHVVVVIAAVLVFGACASHSVRVTSNVAEARVRVDGVDRGVVKDGAAFVEDVSDDHAYDVEVRAPGYTVERVQVRPSEVDARFAPAMVAATTGTCLTSCMSPFVLFTLLDYADAPDAIFVVDESDLPVAERRSTLEVQRDFALSWAVIGGIYGGTALAWWFVANAQSLPDEIRVDLSKDATAVDVSDLPPPPAPAEP
jgi:hypothetical protein